LLGALATIPLALAALISAAPAADYTPPPPPNFGPQATPGFGASDWTITIGGEGQWVPTFEGSRRHEFSGMPVFSIRRFGTPYRFRSPRDNISFAIIEGNGLYAGPVGKFVGSRDRSDDRALRGLRDVDWAVELGGFAEYWWTPWLRTRAEVRQGLGGHRGMNADLNADIVIPVTQQLTFSAGPRVTFSSSGAVDPYFRITPGQAVTSGLPVYDPGGGTRSYGAGAQVRYLWTPQLASYAYVEYDRLTGDVARAPLVRQRGSVNQTRVGLGLTYTFDVRGLWLPIPGR
jgi:MipA family protein